MDPMAQGGMPAQQQQFIDPASSMQGDPSMGGMPAGVEMPEFIQGEAAFQEDPRVKAVLWSRLAQLPPQEADMIDQAITLENLGAFLKVFPELAMFLSEASALDGIEEQQQGMQPGMPGQMPAPPQPQLPPQGPAAMMAGQPQPPQPGGLARQRFGA